MEKINVIGNSANNGVSTKNAGIKTELLGTGCGFCCLGLVCAHGFVCY